MNDTTRDDLRDEILGYFEQINSHLDSHDSFTDAEMRSNVNEIIALVTAAILADRAVPEPDADAVERAASAIHRVDVSKFPDSVRHIPARTVYRERARAALQAAAVPTVQAAAGDDLDALLAELTDDDLPGKTLSIYRHDGQWGAQQHMTHLEEQYPTDVCGHGDGVLEAVLDAVRKAKEQTNDR